MAHAIGADALANVLAERANDVGALIEALTACAAEDDPEIAHVILGEMGR